MFIDNMLESLMLICFAAAWPASIHKSWTSRTRKGKSIFFLGIIFIGYLAGIARVMRREDGGFMLVPYAFNAALVAMDIILYYRNYRIDEGKPPLFGRTAAFLKGFFKLSPRRERKKS